MFVVGSSLKEKIDSFGLIFRYIFIKLLSFTNYHLDLTFFVYKFPSVQNIKRKQRFAGDLESFFSPRQALHTDFAELLDTLDFKTIFYVFFMKI